MELRFTDEERAFRQEVREWIDANLPADTRERMASGRTPPKAMQVDWQKRLYEKGWAVPHWAVEWGGQPLKFGLADAVMGASEREVSPGVVAGADADGLLIVGIGQHSNL